MRLICAGSVMDARLFPTDRGGSIPTSALRFAPISKFRFRQLNRQWHSALPRIGAINTMKVCYGASYEGEIYAVAAWSNPVARSLCQYSVLELRRFAIAPDAPPNTASRMLGWMARDLRRRYPDAAKLISYQDCEIHAGTIYAAAGWQPVRLKAGGGEWKNHPRWNRTAIRRKHKVRWERTL